MAFLNGLRRKVLLYSSKYQQHVHILRGFKYSHKKQPGKTLSPGEKAEVVSRNRNARLLLKPFGFTLLAGGVSFGACSIWQYESFRNRIEGRRHNYSNNEIHKFGSPRERVNSFWNRLSVGQKAAFTIIAINGGVFLAWRIRALHSIMAKYFVSSPFSETRCWPMLFSNWSHTNTFHLLINMYVLLSFSSGVSHQLGVEQFVAVYTTAGVFSAFTSYIMKVVLKSRTPTLGASGAIMALIGLLGIQNPDSRVSIAFVDMIFPHSFTIKTGIIGLICLDMAGIIFAWKKLDHAAHLGGMLFGLWYGKYGHNMIWENRGPFLRYWHDIRKAK